MTQLAEERGWTRRWDEERALGVAREVLGPVLARHAEPVAVRGETLLVEVDHPVWGSEILLNKTLILERINAAMGRPVVRELRARRRRARPRRQVAGRMASGQAAAGESGRSPAPCASLAPERERALAALADPVADPRLREAWRRFVRRVWQLQAEEARAREKGGSAGVAG